MNLELHRRALARCLLGTVIALTSACGSSSGSNSSGPSLEPKLSVIQSNVFQRSCVFSSCHSADTPQKGLNLSGSTYQVLVNKPSSEVPSRMLVVPSNPDGSYLLEKISSDHPTSGARMPYTSTPLPEGEIAAVRQWIELGAQDN